MADLDQPLTFESMAAEASNNITPSEPAQSSQPASQPQAAQPAPQAAPSFGQAAAQPSQPSQPSAPGRQHAPAVPGQAAPQAQAPAAAQPFSVREFLKSQQFAADHFPDDRAAAEALVAQARRAQQIPQIQQYAEYGQRLWAHREQIEALLNGQQQQQQPAPVQAVPPAAAQGNRLKPPDNFDPRWEALVQIDQTTGILKGITPDVPQSIINAVQQQREFNRARLQEVITGWESPAELQTKMMAKVEELVQQRFDAYGQQQQKQVEAQQHRQQLSTIIQQQSGWVYQHDASGKPLLDFDGNKMMTEDGMKYAQLVQALENRGLSDPVYCDAIARHLLATSQSAAAPAQAGAQPAAQVDPKTQRQDRFLNRATPNHQPNTVQAALDPTLPQGNPRGSFLHNALLEAKARGVNVPQEELAAAGGGLFN